MSLLFFIAKVQAECNFLDVQFQIIPNFHPPYADKIRAGVHNSLRQILEKRVVQSLEPLFDNRHMDVELRKLIRETFPEFCANSVMGEVKHEDFVAPVSSQSVTTMDLLVETGLDFGGSPVNNDSEVNNSNHVGGEEAMFSEDEEEPPSKAPPPPAVKPKVEEIPVTPTPALEVEDVKAKVNDVNSTEEKVDLSNYLEFLESDMKTILLDLQNEKDTKQR